MLLCAGTCRGPKTMNRGLRDGSSGYDSSDNETTQQYKQNRKYRSDPDFRMQNVHPSYHQNPMGVGKLLLFLCKNYFYLIRKALFKKLFRINKTG